MGLIDSIRKAEEKARHAYERAADLPQDTQRRLRQKMRIYPHPAERPAAVEGEQEAGADAEPIISISGKDVPVEELSKKPMADSQTGQKERRRSQESAA